jgi:hypothetical protein
VQQGKIDAAQPQAADEKKTTCTATLSKPEDRVASVDTRRRARNEPKLFPTAGSCSEASRDAAQPRAADSKATTRTATLSKHE